MAYRIVTMIGALLLVAMLFGWLWLFCRQFLRHYGVSDQLSERTMVLATWTFAGISVGLLGAVMGAFVLGPWAFYRTLSGYPVSVASGAAVWWGFGIVTLAMVLTTLVALLLLMAVGAF